MWYLSVFVPLAQAGSAEAAARAVWPDDPGAQLSIRLRDADGGEWMGGNVALADAEIATLQGLALIPGVRWYRYGVEDSALAAAFPPGSELGQPWSWAESASDAGLTPVVVPLNGP